MPIPSTVRSFLDDSGIDYELIDHAPLGSADEDPEAPDMAGVNMARAVVVANEAGDDFAVVVVPATEQVDFEALRDELGETYLSATEAGVEGVFTDCDDGVVPPFGQPYGLDVLLDETLLEHERVLVESGDRSLLLDIAGEDFGELMLEARRGRYGQSP